MLAWVHKVGSPSALFLEYPEYPEEKYSGRAYTSDRVTGVGTCVVMVAGLLTWAKYSGRVSQPQDVCFLWLSYLIILTFLKEMKSPSMEFSGGPKKKKKPQKYVFIFVCIGLLTFCSSNIKIKQ